MALNLTTDLTIGGGKKLTDVELIAGAIRTVPSGSTTGSMTLERVEDGQIIYVESEDKLYKADKVTDEFFTTTVTWQPFEWPTSLSAGGDISGSSSSTGSFGRVETETLDATTITADTFVGTFQGALSSSAQIASDITGSFFSLSQSLAARITAEEGEAEGSVVSSSAQIASDISGSLGTNGTLIRSLTATSISGSFTSLSQSLAARITAEEGEAEGSVVSSSAQIASDISGSFTSLSQSFENTINTDSSSIQSRLTTVEAGSTSKTLISSSAQIAEDISGSFVAASQSIAVDINNLQTDSGSFSTRVTNLKTNSGSFSTRVTTLEGASATTGSNHFKASQVITGSLVVTDKVTAQEFHTELVSSSIVYESGSTQFGDSADDTHVFSGSVKIKGSVNADNYTGIFNGALSSSAQIASDISGSLSNTAISALGAGILSGSTQIADSLPSNTISSSAQIASDISGSFSKTHLASKVANVVTSSAQLASDISGSFTSLSQSLAARITAEEGEAEGSVVSSSAQLASDISGSLSNTAIGALNAGIVSGSGQLQDILPAGTLSSSAQIASDISGSLSKEHLATKVADIVTGSAQIASDISGSLSKTHLATKVADIVTGSAQLASDISGSLGTNASLIRSLTSETISGSWRGELSSSNITNVGGGVSGSVLSTGSFGRLQASVIGGNSPLVIQSDNFNVTTEGDISATSANFGAANFSTQSVERLIVATGSVGMSPTFTVDDLLVSSSKETTASFGRLEIRNNAVISGSLLVDGRVFAQEFHSELISSSIIHESGSTKFGDTADDSHDFTGSVNIKGNVTIEDNFSIKGPSITLGDNQNDNVIFNAQVQSDIIPDTSLNHDLGSDSLRWRRVYLQELNAQKFSSVAGNLISGSLSNAAIGALGANIVSSSNQIEGILPADTLSSSAQIASDISGSLSKTHLAVKLPSIVTSSAQLAVDISGSTRGLLSGSLIKDIGGGASGSSISTGSFGHLFIAGNISASGTVRADAFESLTGGTQIDFKDNIDVSGDITASGNISGSNISTGSFGNVIVTGFSGDSNIVNFSSSISSRIAAAVAGGVNTVVGGVGLSDTGTNDKTLNIDFTDATLQANISGSFSKTHLASKVANVVTSSAQLASDISGSIVSVSQSFENTINTDSQSFQQRITVAENELGNTLISSSVQIAEDVSGSWRGELSSSNFTNVGGGVSGSLVSTGSFGAVTVAGFAGNSNLTDFSSSLAARVSSVSSAGVTDVVGGVGINANRTDSTETIAVDFSDATLQSNISGSFNAVSDSLENRITVAETELAKPLLSSSVQIAEDVSGSFQQLLSGSLVKDIGAGVSGSSLSTGSFGRVEAAGVVFADSFESVAGGTNIDFNDSVDVQGDVTASGNILVVNDITSSATSTGSFGNLMIGGFADDDIVNFSSSVQSRLAAISAGEITAITPGVGLSDNAGNSATINSGPVTLRVDFSDTTLQTNISGSFRGELSSSIYLQQMKDVISGSLSKTHLAAKVADIVTGSAQIASDISGSLSNTAISALDVGIVSSSEQLAEDVSGSFRGLLSGSLVKDVGAGVSGSLVSTGSLARIETKMISASKVEGDWLPKSDDIFDLGSETLQWKDLYVDGTGSIDVLSVSERIEYNGVTFNNNSGELVTTGSNFVFKATNNSNLLSLVDTNGELAVKFDERMIVLSEKQGPTPTPQEGAIMYSGSEFHLGFPDA